MNFLQAKTDTFGKTFDFEVLYFLHTKCDIFVFLKTINYNEFHVLKKNHCIEQEKFGEWS